jgi:hypothetical protein
MRPVSESMRIVLRSLIRYEGEGLAEVMLEFESARFCAVKHEGSSFHLADKALDKVLAALERRALIVDRDGGWYVTDAGRATVTP